MAVGDCTAPAALWLQNLIGPQPADLLKPFRMNRPSDPQWEVTKHRLIHDIISHHTTSNASHPYRIQDPGHPMAFPGFCGCLHSHIYKPTQRHTYTHNLKISKNSNNHHCMLLGPEVRPSKLPHAVWPGRYLLEVEAGLHLIYSPHRVRHIGTSPAPE